MPDHPPYVPASYLRLPRRHFVLHMASDEEPSHARWLERIAATAFERITQLLRWTPQRRLHICCYATTSEARQSLHRPIPSDMAMAPFCDDVCSLIIIQSPRCNARNKDPERMLGVLSHELVHVFAAESTGSIKSLGDGQLGMNVSSWLHEGLAEWMRYLVTESWDPLHQAVQVFRTDGEHPSFAKLSQRLDSLDDPLRSAAFLTVTGAVSLLGFALTPAGLFRRLRRIDAACPGTASCTAEYMERVVREISPSRGTPSAVTPPARNER